MKVVVSEFNFTLMKLLEVQKLDEINIKTCIKRNQPNFKTLPYNHANKKFPRRIQSN